MKGFMLDTTVFNHVLDGQIDAASLAGLGRLVATHVQRDQIENTGIPERRARLLATFVAIGPDDSPTESFVIGISRLDRAKLSDGNLYEEIRARLDAIKRHRGNPQDALIAETAIKNGLALVTDDCALECVTREFGGSALRLKDFLSGGAVGNDSRSRIEDRGRSCDGKD